jgi:polyferredoxin
MDGIAAGSFVLFLLLFFLPSLFLGRFLCGYICPLGGLQECLMLVNRKKARGGRANLIKYSLWVPWLLSVALLFLRAGGIKEVDFFFHTEFGVSLYSPLTYFIYYGVLLIVVVITLAAGKRAFCHYVCWMAPFMVIGTKLSDVLKLPRLRLRSEKERCVSCGRCNRSCPMSLDVQAMVRSGKIRDAECILCGECIDICPKKAFSYSLR